MVLYNQEKCDLATSIIYEYLDDNKDDPNKEYLSYLRWTADELVIRLQKEACRLPVYISKADHVEKEPIEVIHGFIEDMDFYVRNGNNEKYKYSFSIAKTIAREIILLFV